MNKNNRFLRALNEGYYNGRNVVVLAQIFTSLDTKHDPYTQLMACIRAYKAITGEVLGRMLSSQFFSDADLHSEGVKLVVADAEEFLTRVR